MELYFEYFHHFHYLGLFILLLLCGMGLPLPEDIVIIAGGYFVYLGSTQLIPTMGVLYAGALLGDILLYGIGRKFGPDIIAHRRLNWLFTPHRIKAINYYFHHYGSLSFFIARFLVGIRSTFFLTAGAFKVSFKKMLLFDGSAALLSIPLLTYLAYRFGGELDQFLIWIRRVEHWIFILAGLLVIVILFRIYHRRKIEKEEPKSSEEFQKPPI